MAKLAGLLTSNQDLVYVLCHNKTTQFIHTDIVNYWRTTVAGELTANQSQQPQAADSLTSEH